MVVFFYICFLLCEVPKKFHSYFKISSDYLDPLLCRGDMWTLFLFLNDNFCMRQNFSLLWLSNEFIRLDKILHVNDIVCIDTWFLSKPSIFNQYQTHHAEMHSPDVDFPLESSFSVWLQYNNNLDLILIRSWSRYITRNIFFDNVFITDEHDLVQIKMKHQI